MNKVFPMFFDWLSQAERVCAGLNEEIDSSDKWIVMPIVKYDGKVW